MPEVVLYRSLWEVLTYVRSSLNSRGQIQNCNNIWLYSNIICSCCYAIQNPLIHYTLCSILGMKYTNMENHEADGSTALGES